MGKVINLTNGESTRAVEFEALLKPHLPYLYKLAYRFTGNSFDAEDLVQEVLLKICPKYNKICREKIRSWLTRVAYTTFIDQKRRFKRSPFSLLKSSDAGDGTGIIEKIESTEPGPEETVKHKLLNQMLMEAIAMLNKEQKAVCILHDIEGYTLTELEGMLNIPIGTLKSRLHRARAILKKIVKHGTF